MHFAEQLNNKFLRNLIQNEIIRMASLNYLLGEILLKKRPRGSWVKELETHMLLQTFSKAELKSMTKEQKRSALVQLLFPPERAVL